MLNSTFKPEPTSTGIRLGNPRQRQPVPRDRQQPERRRLRG